MMDKRLNRLPLNSLAPKRRQALFAGLGLGALGFVGGGAALLSAHHGLRYGERVLLGFGASLHLQAWHTEAAQLNLALNRAVLELQSIEQIMSVYRSTSQVSQLNRDGLLRAPDHRLVEVLTLAQKVSAASQGAFDVTMQPLWQVWWAAAKQGALPAPSAVQQAAQLVSWAALKVSAEQLVFSRPGMALSLNGIAQGYAADRVKQVMQEHGIEHALLNTGEWSGVGLKDPGALGQDKKAPPANLLIEHPDKPNQYLARLAWDGRSVATSSDAHTVFSADRAHHHVLDPRTGYSPKALASVTVVATSCALADALTKVFFMLGEAYADQADSLCRQWQVDALLMDKQGSVWKSAGLALAAA